MIGVREVAGSNPVLPTIFINQGWLPTLWQPSCFVADTSRNTSSTPCHLFEHTEEQLKERDLMTPNVFISHSNDNEALYSSLCLAQLNRWADVGD